MKTLQKNLLTASLLLATTAVLAQKQVIVEDLETWMSSLISKAIDNKVEVTKSFGQERDVQKEGSPLKWRRDIMTFTLPKKQRPLLDEMIKAFEANGHNNPNCYGINSMSESSDGNLSNKEVRRLMIGEDTKNYIEIGKDYNNYLNVNILDVSDTTKTHRYAYALEWSEDYKGKTDVRYIVTYARIPSATSTITSRSWPFLDMGKARIKPGDRITIEGPARFHLNGKDYPIDKIDSVFRDAEKRSEQNLKAFVKGNSVVIWADSLDHDTDPVADVVIRLQQGKDITADDFLCNENILLIFSQLKQQYLAGQNTEFNAISIYTLCKKAREYGFFTSKFSKEELEQLKRELSDLIGDTPHAAKDRAYLNLALLQLKKIQ